MRAAMSERTARMAWSWLAECDAHETRAEVLRLGPQHALERALAGDRVGPSELRARVRGLDLEAMERVHRRCDIRTVIPGDPEWPERLDLISDPPYCLYVRGGGDVGQLASRSVALVGMRAATEYGVRTAADLAEGVSARGMVVVSGAAFGIDAASHRGALASDAPTVAVLACGLDRAYPLAHAALLDQIAVDGAVVSEQPVGYAPFASRFLARNRLISGISGGTVVVEAALRSGAVNTAGHAQEQCRPLGAVPGPVGSRASAGCHQLIRNGAVLVTDAAEVLDLCGDLGGDAVVPLRGLELPLDHLPAQVRAVHDAVPPRAGVGVDHIVRVTGQPPLTVIRHLAVLVVDGHLRERGGTWVRVRRRGVADCANAPAG